MYMDSPLYDMGGQRGEKILSLAWIMKTCLRAVSKTCPVQGNWFCPLQFGIQNHQPGASGGGSFGVEQMPSVIGPTRLHAVVSSSGQCTAGSGGKTILVYLEAPAHCSRKSNLRRVGRIPARFRAMRASFVEILVRRPVESETS